MARFDDILSGGNWATGFAIGVGAVVILPLATPILRPLAKTAIKGGILAYRGAAGMFGGLNDLVAECDTAIGPARPPGDKALDQSGERRHPSLQFTGIIPI
jgi:hypothetical protein